MRSIILKSPVGNLRLTADEKGLVALDYLGAVPVKVDKRKKAEDAAFFRPYEKALKEFFSGKKLLPRFPRSEFPGTEFQRKVWKAVEKIPFGETRSYGEIAMQIGHPRASRAVGAACGKNPMPLFIPCHRVVSSNGIGGYSDNIEIKKTLLRLEGGYPQGIFVR